MEEDQIRQLARCHAIISEIESVKTQVMAMNWENVERENEGRALAYTTEMFFEQSKEFIRLSKRLMDEI